MENLDHKTREALLREWREHPLTLELKRLLREQRRNNQLAMEVYAAPGVIKESGAAEWGRASALKGIWAEYFEGDIDE